MLIERCSEFNLPLFIAAVDYGKAFDSVEHASIWSALREQGVDVRYVQLLANLYEDQVGHVSIGSVISKPFKVGRGTKQGDPLSPALFNAVLEKVLREIQLAWRKKGYGIALGAEDTEILTNL